MKGLLIKDILNFKKNIFTIAGFLLIYFAIDYISRDSTVISPATILVFTMMGITSMTYDDLAKWNTYALTMPISRKEIVLSKYILSILLSFIGAVISLVLSYIIIILKNNNMYSYLLVNTYSLLLAALLFSSIIYPLIYKFGVEQARIIVIALIAIPGVIFYLLTIMGINPPSKEQIKILFILSPAIIAIMLYLSFKISYNIYKKIDL